VCQLVNELQTGHLLEKKWRQTWPFPTQETLDNTGPYLEAPTIYVFREFVPGNWSAKGI
jgi:hypothetical protein